MKKKRGKSSVKRKPKKISAKHKAYLVTRNPHNVLDAILGLANEDKLKTGKK
jgi:hypothetical protein